MKARRTITITAAVVGLTVVTAVAAAGPGSLDPGFGGVGIVTTDFGGTELAGAVAVQPDGRIVAGGDTSAGTTFATSRWLATTPTGSLDTSFGGGKVTTDIGGWRF